MLSVYCFLSLEGVWLVIMSILCVPRVFHRTARAFVVSSPPCFSSSAVPMTVHTVLKPWLLYLRAAGTRLVRGPPTRLAGRRWRTHPIHPTSTHTHMVYPNICSSLLPRLRWLCQQHLWPTEKSVIFFTRLFLPLLSNGWKNWEEHIMGRKDHFRKYWMHSFLLEF